LIDLTLYVITAEVSEKGRSHLDVAQAAIEGGATVIQYRGKDRSSFQAYEEAEKIRALCRERGIPFMVNDRVDIALAVKADGVHLGQEDLPIEKAREIFPAGFIGASVRTVEEAVEAEEKGANYLGVGPIFPTISKEDAGEAIGVEELRRICQATSLPVVAIGGINIENLRDVIMAGATGIAVISAVALADDMIEATRSLRNLIEEMKER
jgi:thiamine-phosphate pyrophosphorylase